MSFNIQLLRDMLAQDTTAITQLKSLLLAERDLLEQRKLSGMQDIVAQKDQLLGNLAFTAKQRAQLLRTLGLPTDLIGWMAFLERDQVTAALIPEWQLLNEQFAQCHEANEVNGRMIHRSKQTLTQLLNLIRGQVAAPSLYTQKGATTNNTGSYTVAKA